MTDTSPDQTQLKLPEVLDVGVAAALAAQLQALRGQPLTLDASGVQRVGGLSLQVLLSARLTWENDAKPLRVAEPSPAFEEALALYGASSLIAAEKV